MKTLLILLLLCAAVRNTSSNCSSATVQMHRSEQTGDEGDAITLNFDLSCFLNEDIFTIDLSYQDGTAVGSGVDYSGTSKVSIPTSVSFFSTMVTLEGDDIVENDENFLVEITGVGFTSSPAGDMVYTSTVPGELSTSVTIEDDDTVTVSLPDTIVTVSESDLTASVTVSWFSMVDVSGFTQVINYISGSASENDDYTTAEATVTLGVSPATSAVLDIPIIGNSIVEDYETFTVSLGAASTPTSFARSDAIFTDSMFDSTEVVIEDDDTVVVNFPLALTDSEGASVLFRVLFFNMVQETGFSFTYSILATSDAETDDYSFVDELSSTVVPIDTSVTSDMFSITFVDDSKVEDDETIMFVLHSVSAPSHYVRTDAITIGGLSSTTVCSITDNDDGTVSLATTASSSEPDSSVTTTIFLSKQVEDAGYSISLTFTAGTATFGSDYPMESILISIPSCTDSFVMSFPIIDDNLVEDNEIFSVSIATVMLPMGFRSDALQSDITSDETTFTIFDDETASVGVASIGSDTESNSVTVTLDVSLPGGGFQDSGYSVTLTIFDGTTETADVVTRDFTVGLPLNADASVSFSLFDDAIFEDFETYTASIVAVNPPSGFSRTSGDVIVVDAHNNQNPGTIIDDDTVTVRFESASTTINEGNFMSFFFEMDAMFEDFFTLTLDFGGDLNQSPMDFDQDYVAITLYGIPTSVLSFTRSISVISDDFVEDTEIASVTITSVGFPSDYGRNTGLTIDPANSLFPVIVLDDDSATVEVFTSSLTVTETDSGTLTETITIEWDNTILVSGFSVDLSWSDLTAVDGTDYYSGVGSLEIPTETTGHTFIFTFPADEVVEDFESFQVTLSSITDPGGLVRTDMPVKISATADSTDVTIIDDDTATICLDQSATSATEGGGYDFYTVTTDLEIEDQFSVSVNFIGDSATSPDDFLNTDTTENLPISSDATAFSASFKLSIADDTKIEDDESMTISIDSIIPPSVFVRSTPAVVIGTCSSVETVIYDDDTATVEMDLRQTQGPESSGVIVNVDISGGELCTPSFSITLSYSDSTAEDGSDYSGVYSAEIPTYAGTESQFFFLISVISDSIVEDNEIFEIILTDVGNTGVTRTDMVVITSVSEDQSTTVTIMDDDSATLTVVSSDLCPTEGDATAEITLALDNQVQDAGFSFSLAYADIDALSSNDYSDADTQDEIPTLTNTFTFTVTLSDDMVVEAEQSFSVTFSAVSLPTTYMRTDGIYLHPTDTTSSVTIKDDDTATLSLTSKVSVSEGDPSAEITVFLSNPIEDSTGFSAGLSYIDGDTVESSDYSAGSAAVAIPQNPTTELTVTVDLIDDIIVEDHESFSVQLVTLTDPLTSNSMRIGVPDSSTVCIFDDDTATLALDIASTVNEMDTTVTLAVSITGGTVVDSGFTATLGYMDSEAVRKSDFSSNTEVPIPASAVSTTVNVVILSDEVVEDNEDIVITLEDVGHPFTLRTTGAVVPHPASSTETLEIIDDDTATLSFRSNTQTGDEADISVEVIVDLSKVVQDSGFSFEVAFSPLSAEENDDYSTSTTTFAISAMSTSSTMTVDISDDAILEDNELFTIALQTATNPASYGRPSPGIIIGKMSISTTVTIDDNDFATCTFSPSSVTGREDASHLTATIECDIPVEDDGFTFTLGFSDDTAFSGMANDYSAETMTVPYDTANTLVDFSVLIVDNDVVEDFESFSVEVTGIALPSGFTRTNIISVGNTGTLTIEDDDTATCTISDKMYSTSEIDGASIDVEVVCSNELAVEGFSIDIDVLDESAVNMGDYDGSMVMPTIDILTSQSTFFLSVPVVGDNIVEDTESFLVALGSVNTPGGFMRTDAVSLEDSTGTLTITDDDSATCSFTIDESVMEGMDVSVTVECSNPVQDSGFSVSFQYFDDTAVYDNDYTATIESVDIPTLTTQFMFSVETLDDMVVEDTQSFEVHLNTASSPGGFLRADAISVEQKTCTATIEDDDTLTCSMLTDFLTVTENQQPSVDIELSCDLEVEEAGFTIAIGFTDKDAQAGLDFTGSPTAVPVPVMETSFTFSVDILNDEVVEDFQSFCLDFQDVLLPSTFIRTDGTEAVTSSAEITIVDDDTAVCGIDPTPVCVTEGIDSHATVNIVCDKVIEDSGLMLDVAYRDGSAFNPDDYIGTVTMVSIPSGSLTFPFEIPINDDTLIEDDEIFEVILVDVIETGGFQRADAARLGTISGSVTIKDTDSVTCSFATSDVTVNEDVNFLTLNVECNGEVNEDGYSFDYTFLDDSAIFPDDVTSDMLVFSLPTATTSVIFSVSIINDNIVENTQSFRIEVTNINIPMMSDAVFFTGTQTVSITDDDTATCTFVSSDVCVDETVRVYDSAVSCDTEVEESGFGFQLASTDLTATGSEDYTLTTTLFDYTTSVTDLSFQVSMISDNTVEDHQSFYLEVASVTFPGGFSNMNAVVFEGTQTLTIKDDDTATCSFENPVIVETEDVSATATISCDKDIEGSGISFGFDFIDGTATAPSDYLTVSNTVALLEAADTENVNARLMQDDVTLHTVFSQSTFEFMIEFVDDSVVEGDESFAVQLTNVNYPDGFQHTTGIVVDGTATATIFDQDTVTCEVSLEEECITESDGAAVLQIDCDAAIEADGFSIEISTEDVTATLPADYSLSNTFIEIPMLSATFTSEVGIVNDGNLEPDETFVLVINDGQEPAGFRRSNVISVNSGSLTITIKDDDVLLMTTERMETTDEDETTEGGTTDRERTTQSDDQPAEEGLVAGDRNLGIEDNPCLFGNPCSGENMECSSVDGIATCYCVSGYELQDPDSNVCKDINECLTSPCNFETEECTNTIGSYACVCQDGFKKNLDGECKDIDECEQSPCLEHQQCLNLNGSFQCLCMDGFELSHDETCIDIDECKQSPCSENQFCVNLRGSFRCACRDGFRTSSDGDCTDINECEEGNDNCAELANTKCVNTIGNFSCICQDGYRLNSSGACIPAHRCTSSFSSTCRFPEDVCMVDEFGEYFCACSPGFRRTTSFSPCENINECIEDSSICTAIPNAHCVDRVPTISNPDLFYMCECDDGFVEVENGKCVEERHFRLGLLVLGFNNEEGSALWSSDLQNKSSARFRQVSEYLCSFFQDAISVSQDVNKTTCHGVGFSLDKNGLRVALGLSVLSSRSFVMKETVSAALLAASDFRGNDVRVWGTLSRDTLAVQDSSFHVNNMDDINCVTTACVNGGTCIMNEILLETSCICLDGFRGVHCELDARNDTADEGETKHRNRTGLFIAMTFVSLVIFIIMSGICCILMTSQKRAVDHSSHTAFRRTPGYFRARPLLNKVPDVVRNPLSKESQSTYTEEEIDNQERRLHNFERAFVRMGVLDSDVHSRNQDFENTSSRNSREFSIPYAADGSTNV